MRITIYNEGCFIPREQKEQAKLTLVFAFFAQIAKTFIFNFIVCNYLFHVSQDESAPGFDRIWHAKTENRTKCYCEYAWNTIDILIT